MSAIAVSILACRIYYTNKVKQNMEKKVNLNPDSNSQFPGRTQARDSTQARDNTHEESSSKSWDWTQLQGECG